MNAREKLLVTIVAAIVVAGVGLGARRLYIDRSEKLAQDLRYEKNKLKEANKKLEAAKAKERDWRGIGKQTISADAMVAKGKFREELIDLVRKSGFPIPPAQVDLIGTVTQGRNSLSVVICQVKAEGTMDQVVSFLHQLDRQPYLARCKSIGLKPVTNKAGTPGATPSPTGRLALSLSIETPILPSDKKVPKFDTAELTPGKRVPVGRLEFAMADGYSAIRKELFQHYVPPPPKPPEPPIRPPTVPTSQPRLPVELPPPPPADAELVLARILSSPRSQQVVLEHPTNKGQEDKRVEVGDPLYGGVLIFIHRTGAVSEREEKDGKKQRTFHAIGQPLKQGQILSMTEHPVVYDALMKLEERLAGINKPEKIASP